MVQKIADRRDIDFVLYEQLQADELTSADRYSDLNKKMFDMVITEARNFAIKEILPLNEEGDKIGLKFENNQVTVPDCFHRAWQMLREGDWITITEDPEIGGQGLPQIIAQAAFEYIIGADQSFGLFFIPTHGAAKMIEVFGTEQQKKLYMEKMYSGQWGGTMALTEPQAGSDVGALETTAIKNADGTYSISGNKIFITSGEQNLTENIIHPVLARIEGAPSGTKGISLFLVPKIWVNDDGSLGNTNDVVCTAIEEKMGLHASPTCQLTFGGKGKCRGVLLGEENRGMQVMFHMMNKVRLEVGASGMHNASCAYLYALGYALERIQGRDLSDMMKKDAPAVNIIKHPDIRRMLLWLKSHSEGMRSLIYYVAKLFDQEKCATDMEEKNRCDGLINLLTPVVKSYCTDRGFEATVLAMQVYGGYGYTADYPVERLMRDSKINSIYEGTNGIQAMDLLGRKIGMKKGAVVASFMDEVKNIIHQAKEVEDLVGLAEDLEKTIIRLQEVILEIGKTATSPDFKLAYSYASPFLEVMGDTIIGWMLLWRAVVAKSALDKLGSRNGSDIDKKNKNVSFYEGQIESAEYYIRAILPIARGRIEALLNNNRAIIDIEVASFGG